MKYPLGTFCDICKNNKARQHKSTSFDGYMITLKFDITPLENEGGAKQDVDICDKCAALVVNKYLCDILESKKK